LSIVRNFDLKPLDVNSWKIPPNAFNYSEAELDFIAMGFEQLHSNEYITIAYQFYVTVSKGEYTK
jgi:hypothetical protein